MTPLKVKITEQPPPGWDELIASVGSEASYHQTSVKAAGSRIHDRSCPFYLTAVDPAGRPAALALVQKMYLFDHQAGKKLFFLPYLRCRGGPAILNRDLALPALTALLKAVAALALKNLAMHIEFQGFSPLSACQKDPVIDQAFERAGYKSKKWATLLIDLEKEEEALWGGLNRAAKKCVKKCRRNEVGFVRAEDYEDFQKRFWQPYLASEASAGRSGYDYPLSLWQATSNYLNFYTASTQQGEPLAFLGLLTYGGLATEISSGTTPLSFEKKLPAQDLLHWELMMAAKKAGCRTFDLAGVNPAPATPKEQGIRRFKEKWGGEYVEYSTWRKEVIPFMGRLQELGRKWKNRS